MTPIESPALPAETVDPLGKSWIQHTPNVCGGRACIRRTRIPVWLLASWRELGLSDARILEHHPSLSQMDLDVAWEYYARHKEEIDNDIQENEQD